MKKILMKVLPERTLAKLSAFDHYMRGEPEIRLIRKLCQKDEVALDVGANIGTYTYFLNRYAKLVYAYEPNPQLAGRLARLYPGVQVRNLAVSDSERSLTLRIPVVDGRAQHELASVSDTFADEEVVEYEVKAVTIDSEGLHNVGFMKVDVELHELHVLRGALSTISNSRPIIMTECTPLLYERNLPATFGFLTELNYEGWFSFEGRFYPFSDFRSETHANPEQFGKSFMRGNVFFFPNEIPGKEILT